MQTIKRVLNYKTHLNLRSVLYNSVEKHIKRYEFKSNNCLHKTSNRNTKKTYFCHVKNKLGRIFRKLGLYLYFYVVDEIINATMSNYKIVLKI